MLEINIDKSFSQYLHLLKQLVAINTVYSNSIGIYEALRLCQSHFRKYLKNYDIYFDNQSNLICKCRAIDKTKDVLYLSAHIDTVPANKSDWDPRYDPFNPYEDDQMIVGRGVNDDKAGVAYQLYLAQLLSENRLAATNIIFTITAKEEQSGQSAREIGTNLGKKLPVGPTTYLFTLENNCHVAHPPILCINYGERGSIGLEITTHINVLRNFLLSDKNLWNPTVIVPIKSVKTNWTSLNQMGGHAATLAREKNLLYQLLTSKTKRNFVLKAGSDKAISVVPNTIYQTTSAKPLVHRAIFDLRTMKSGQELSQEISRSSFDYRFVKLLDHGFDIFPQLKKNKIYKIIKKLSGKNMQIKFEINPGSTDSGTIYKYATPKIKKILLPLTLGPGSRSQRHTAPPRLTHGVNETFDKKAGEAAVKYITQLLYSLDFAR